MSLLNKTKLYLQLMRIHLIALAATMLGGAIHAQTNQQIELQGWRTSYTSRGNLGLNTGELHQGFHGSHHVGLCENGGAGAAAVTQFSIVNQDQNASTLETFDFVLRSGNDATGPDVSSAGILGEVIGINMPASTLFRALAWRQTVTLTAGNEIAVPNTFGGGAANFWSVGVRMPMGITNDWMGCHTSYGTNAVPHQNSWNEQLPAPTTFVNHAWQIPDAATAATQPGGYRTWRLTVATQGVAMQLGCGTIVTPTSAGGIGYGMGGMFPRSSDATTPLGFHARLRGGAGMAGAVNGVAVAPAGLFVIAVPFGTGAQLYLDTTNMLIFFGAAADAAGQSNIEIAPFIPNLGLAGAFDFPVQGVMDNGASGPVLSNTQLVTPQ